MHLRDPPSIFIVFLQKILRMTPRSLLSVLLLLCSSCTVWCAAVCNNRCCSFVEGFPARLKLLRESYSQIRDYYVSKRCSGSICDRAAAASFGAWADTHRPRRWAGSLQVMLLVSICSQRALSLQEANDDLDLVLLDHSVVESFKVRFYFCYN